MRREQALSDLFVGFGPSLRRTAYLIVHDWHTSEDLVQATFVKLYLAWPRIREDELHAYARRTLVNASLSHLCKQKRAHVMAVVPDTGTEYDRTPRDLIEAIAKLPPQQRAAITLRFLDQLSVAEVADILNVATGTVKSQTSRALTALRKSWPDTRIEETLR